MDPVESKIRAFAAALFVSPGFRNWVRVRAHELRKQGRDDFEIVLVWGRRTFRVGNIPDEQPYFAIRRPDGTLEQSPYVNT
jgi:hypothetical protein